MTEHVETSKKQRVDGSVFVGILLLALGALFLLNNLNVFYIGDIWSFWPFILVVLGVQKVMTADSSEKTGSGLWLVFVGFWLFISIEGIWGLDFENSWPALLIVWGLGMIWRSFGRPWPFAKKETGS